MKKLNIFLINLILFQQLSAQTTDSISMNPGYTDEVYWSLPSGNAGSFPINGWELAFRLGLQTSSIFINSANGVSLFHVPNTDTSGWATFDTTGITSWKELFNSDTSWEYGAFDISSTGFPDFSWGDYDLNTHIVTGDSLYIIKLNSSTYKKLWIIKKDFGNWTFRYANLDNTEDVTVTINGADFPNKNFAYYSITNSQTLNSEPDNSAWDLLFTRYLTLLPPDNTPYLVSGVLTNVGVETAEARPVDLSTVDLSNYTDSFTSNISQIGYDWKYFDMTLNEYFVEDSLCYFVKSINSDIYKIVFKSFEGSSTGNISWEQTFLLTSLSPIQKQLESASVFPNPVTNYFDLIFYARESLSNVDIEVYNVDGRRVMHTLIDANQGLNQKKLTLPELASGVYLVNISTLNDGINLKMVVAR
ncbi:MAG: T9SS type A sorting domain-containing protein [Chitinophagales bacterium]|nr:T9SS type A sorting domain-containing protein [Chitinophagales bacterium]